MKEVYCATSETMKTQKSGFKVSLTMQIYKVQGLRKNQDLKVRWCWKFKILTEASNERITKLRKNFCKQFKSQELWKS